MSEKIHLNIEGPRGWTTACGIESPSFVDRHKVEEYYAIDCMRCIASKEYQKCQTA